MAYIAVRLPGGATLSRGAARTLVSYALRRRHCLCWPALRVDLFAGGGETLLLARPAAPEVRIAAYALPALRKYLRS